MATSTQQKQELFKAIWATAEDLRNSVDGWDFKSYVLGVLPPMGLFGNAGVKRAEKKQNVIRRFKEFFERFFDISGGNFYSPENP